jgi:hypothetical protein
VEAPWTPDMGGGTQYDAPEVDGIFYLTAREICLTRLSRRAVTGSAGI